MEANGQGTPANKKNPKKFLHMTKVFAGQKKKGPKFKFGISVPQSVCEAYKLDKINSSNTLLLAMDQCNLQEGNN